MLDCKDADRTFEANDRHSGKAVEAFFAGLRLVDIGGMLGRLGQVEDAPLGCDRADETLAEAKAGHVNRLLAKTVGCEKLEIIIAQEVDRADLALHLLSNEIDDLVELGLGRTALRHDFVETGKDLAG
jgi:hypothetical protein